MPQSGPGAERRWDSLVAPYDLIAAPGSDVRRLVCTISAAGVVQASSVHARQAGRQVACMHACTPGREAGSPVSHAPLLCCHCRRRCRCCTAAAMAAHWCAAAPCRRVAARMLTPPPPHTHMSMQAGGCKDADTPNMSLGSWVRGASLHDCIRQLPCSQQLLLGPWFSRWVVRGPPHKEGWCSANPCSRGGWCEDPLTKRGGPRQGWHRCWLAPRRGGSGCAGGQ